MAVLFRCIESYGVVAPLEDDCHPCVHLIINLFASRRESRRPTAASTTDLCATSVKRLLRRRSLARPWTLLRELDAVGEAHVYAQATDARATSAREQVRIITGRRPRADDARPQHITLGQPCRCLPAGAHHLSQRSVAASIRSSASPERTDHVYRLSRLAVGLWPPMLMLTVMLSQQCVTAATCRRTQPFADHTRGYKRSARSAMRPRRC